MVPSILVVDDDARIRALLCEFLEVDGHEVAAAPDGLAALTYLRQHHSDLVLLDLMMPIMDGWTFLRESRADPDCRDVPVVVISAVAGRSGTPILDPRVRRVVPKPFELAQVESAIADVVGGAA